MATPQIGDKVPAFKAASTGDQTFDSESALGKNIVLYFYPKDSTPGCTREGIDFRDHIAEFEALDTLILGVSRDGLRSHENFRTKQCFPFDLLSDPEEELCRLFDVIRLKNMYGRQVMGIERSTFLIDREGKLAREWRKVKVPDHVATVLEAVQELES